MHPRAAWCARPPRSRSVLHDPLAITVHWEGVGVGLTDPKHVPRVISAVQDFHMDSRRMVDIAYNWLIDPWGELWEGRGGGVRSGANGTDYANDHHLAVCVLTGPGDPLLRPVVFAALAALRDEYCLPLRRHSDEKPTACPGPELSAWVHANTEPRPHAQPPLEDILMPYLLLHDPESEAIWALFPGGVVRHIGGAEWTYYESKDVPMKDVADRTEAERLTALVG